MYFLCFWSKMYFFCKSNTYAYFYRYHRAKPIIIDAGLYSLHKSDVFWATEKRDVPTAYKLFTGEKHLPLILMNHYLAILFLKSLALSNLGMFKCCVRK